MRRTLVSAIVPFAAFSALSAVVACSGDGGTGGEPSATDAGATQTDSGGTVSDGGGTVTDGGGTAACGAAEAQKCAVGEACAKDGDCAARNCSGGVCKSPSCTNGKNDGTETGVDCGGTCPDKCDGAACGADAECKSRVCKDGTCAAKGTKTCGVGTATPCANGAICEQDKDCATEYCSGSVCSPVDANAHQDGRANAGETGVDCGGVVAATQACPGNQACKVDNDCQGLCKANVCTVPNATDGKKNQGETDIDCGGPNAPKCVPGKTCAAGGDCVGNYCKAGVCTAPTANDGIKNGNETDIDCGGARFQQAPIDYTAPACALGKACAADSDCATDACFAGKCIEAKSCKRQFGGTTCGAGEVGDPGVAHESCCKSLPVPGFADPKYPGKTVYLDKYEITAGRLRQFIEATNGNTRGWIAANRPAVRWRTPWEQALPAGFDGALQTYAVSNPTADLAYPGQDQYAPDATQNTWQVRSGNWDIYPGVNTSMGSLHFFPEYLASGGWPSPDYAATHGFNCGNAAGSYGFGTYWLPANVLQAQGSLPRGYTQEQMDVKAANCAPVALFAAFCAWDGGQLMTDSVYDYVTQFNARLPAGYNGNCTNGLNTSSDGATACNAVYNYPFGGGTNEGAHRIAPPGRVAADVVRINAGDEPWRDLAGNVMEAVLTTRALNAQTYDIFTYRGFGLGWGTIQHHRNQTRTPRMKQASLGARCMRFR